MAGHDDDDSNDNDDAGDYDNDDNQNFHFRDVIDVVRGFFNGTAADTEWKLFVVSFIIIIINTRPWPAFGRQGLVGSSRNAV